LGSFNTTIKSTIKTQQLSSIVNRLSSIVNPIFLIGFSGSGKSYWGKRWAEAYKMTHVDLDDLIEQSEGMSIAEIFAGKGEQYFREKEKQILDHYSNDENTIISCGGGTPCFGDNIDLMNSSGMTVYLRAGADFLHERLMNEAAARPLISNLSDADLLFYITNKLAEREPEYLKAKIILNAEDLSNDSLYNALTSNLKP
jgi:shikimate kinase